MIPRRKRRQDRADGRPIEHGPEARARSLRRSSFERREDGALTTPLSTPQDGAEAANSTPGCRVSMRWLPGKPPAVGAVRQTGKKRRCKERAGRRRALTPRLEQLQTRVVPAGTWTALSNLAPGGVGTMMLLSDGSVMAQGAGVSNAWYKLTPGSDGGYATHGTWSTSHSMSLQRLYYGSNILKDGRVFVLGGEYSGPSGAQNFTNTGEIYNPVTNTWTATANFPQDAFGDDPTMLLDDGRVLCGYIFGPRTYLYDPAHNTWTQTGTKLRDDSSDEETWLKLADGSILSYDVFNDAESGESTAQRYVPSTGQWADAGTVPVDLSSYDQGDELGGATLLADGRAWFLGSTGHTAFYSPSSNTWAAGPDLPGGQYADDAPLCQLPNGHVLLEERERKGERKGGEKRGRC